jgi:hypothetical protein
MLVSRTSRRLQDSMCLLGLLYFVDEIDASGRMQCDGSASGYCRSMTPRRPISSWGWKNAPRVPPRVLGPMPGYVPWSDRPRRRRRRDDQRWRTPTQTVRSLLIYPGLSLALFILGIVMGWFGVIVTAGVVAGLSLVESAIFLPRALAASRSGEAVDRRSPPTP